MKQPRKYSLFVKEGKNWTRLTPLALTLPGARRFFQGVLLDGTMNGLNMALRPAGEDHANEAAHKVSMERLFPKPKTKVLVMDHATNAEGELVDAGEIEVELDD